MKIRVLDEGETAALIEGLELAAKLVHRPLPLSIDAVQELYDALLKDGSKFDAGNIAAGLAFGQLIVDKAGYEWVCVSDEYGVETCLSPKGTALTCAPVSMIQKRLSKGDRANLMDLMDETIKVVASMIASGEYQMR